MNREDKQYLQQLSLYEQTLLKTILYLENTSSKESFTISEIESTLIQKYHQQTVATGITFIRIYKFIDLDIIKAISHFYETNETYRLLAKGKIFACYLLNQDELKESYLSNQETISPFKESLFKPRIP